MNRLIALSLYLLLQIQSGNCQTLPDPVFSQLPCYINPGMTDTLSVFPVPGATGYIWTIDSMAINAVLYNGGISPQQTANPTCAITCVLPRPFYEVCVTAFSPCCTSATVCDTIWGVPPLVFDSTNNASSFPNTTSQYSIYSLCNFFPNNSILFWFVTGDIGINGTGSNSATTGGANPFVNLNFGPGFTTGELCVYMVTNFGLTGDTICMTINAPTGINEYPEQNISIHYNSENQQIVCTAPFLKGNDSVCKLYDIKGNRIFEKKVNKTNSTAEIRLKTGLLRPGTYILEVQNGNQNFSRKFVITN